MGKVMHFKIQDVTVDLIAEDDRICDHVKNGYEFEPESLNVWYEICKSAGTVIDVGGYSGLFSILAAKLGCNVVCIEPMPLNAARILKNCRLNGVTIELHQAVASNQNGSALLTYNPKVKGMTSGASLIRKKGFQLDVKAITIDSLNKNPIAIKIDVERGEPLVLEGAIETIERNKPTLLVEVLDKEREEKVKAAVSGYKVTKVIDIRNWVMVPC